MRPVSLITKKKYHWFFLFFYLFIYLFISPSFPCPKKKMYHAATHPQASPTVQYLMESKARLSKSAASVIVCPTCNIQTAPTVLHCAPGPDDRGITKLAKRLHVTNLCRHCAIFSCLNKPCSENGCSGVIVSVHK
jgi:hypothetical protein